MSARAFAAFAVCVALGGCATPRSVFDARREGEGVSRVLAAPYAVVFVAVRDVLHDEDAEDVEERPDLFYLTASHGPTAFSWGGFVGAFFEPIDPMHTRVTIVSKRKMATNIGTPFPEDELVAKIAEKLPEVARRPELRYAYGPVPPVVAPAASLPPPPPRPPGAATE